MRLHILAGCREFLQPDDLKPELAASLIGPQVRLATAFWLSPKCGKSYHRFLQDEPGDRRTKIMAMALGDEFGNRFEPLLVLPDLLHEIESKPSTPSLESTAVRSQLTVLSEIQAYGKVEQIRLHGLALPADLDRDDSWASIDGLVTDKVRDRLEHLCTEFVARTGADDIDAEVIEVTPESPAFGTIYCNAISSQVALRLASRLHKQGWSTDIRSLAAAISDILSDWRIKGIFPNSTMQAKQLDAILEIILRKWF